MLRECAGRLPARKQDRRWRMIARNVELYSLAYRTAWDHISALQKGQHPNTSLRLHASIRRQIKEGAKNPSLIAAKAVSDVQTNTAVTHKRHARTRRKPSPQTE